MEIDPVYCDVIITRFCTYTDNYFIKINGNEINWQEYKAKELVNANN